MERIDAQLFAPGSDILSSQHGGVWGRFVTIGLDLHSAGNTADSFAATGITQTSASETSAPSWRQFQCGSTNLRSVTWTNVSLKEAKMRATPKTSSPE